METHELVFKYASTSKSLLLLEVELMETRHGSGSFYVDYIKKSLLLLEVELMET